MQAATTMTSRPQKHDILELRMVWVVTMLGFVTALWISVFVLLETETGRIYKSCTRICMVVKMLPLMKVTFVYKKLFSQIKWTVFKEDLKTLASIGPSLSKHDTT
jgi:hypothetical protein